MRKNKFSGRVNSLSPAQFYERASAMVAMNREDP
jgi:hypothetical protein